MDLLALINNGVNFILYCTMSRAFRKTFQKTFCCNCICLFRPIKKATASRSNQSKAGNPLQKRSSLPSEKLNLLGQRLDGHPIKKAGLMNETIDDDDGLVTINETSLKQNSSTAEMEGDPADGEEVKLRKSSAQDTIPEDGKEDHQEDSASRPDRQRIATAHSSSSLRDSLSKMPNSSSASKIANGSLSQVVTQSDSHSVQLQGESNAEADWQANERPDSRLKIHRNSSIDSTCNRRKQLLHRHNDSRRRYRRKTIANIKSDGTANCASNGCKNSLTTCV